ncbi:sigma-70 family RNA polymerase sigma factor [Puniceicoccaceae bacterium K14]|nr:sigma-70 family RNA polymerase sigma factor [Puniceicoccaceae bacterium K14]
MNTKTASQLNPHSTAFVGSVMQSYDEIKAFFRRRVDCQHEAEDLAHDTFTRILKYQPSKTVDQPRQFLFRVARNLLIDRARKRQGKAQIEVGVNDAETCRVSNITPCEITDARERLEFLEKTVEGLPKRCREVFILNRFYGLSYNEIAERLEISPSTVEKHMIRAISDCRKTLKKLDAN